MRVFLIIIAAWCAMLASAATSTVLPTYVDSRTFGTPTNFRFSISAYADIVDRIDQVTFNGHPVDILATKPTLAVQFTITPDMVNYTRPALAVRILDAKGGELLTLPQGITTVYHDTKIQMSTTNQVFFYEIGLSSEFDMKFINNERKEPNIDTHEGEAHIVSTVDSPDSTTYRFRIAKKESLYRDGNLVRISCNFGTGWDLVFDAHYQYAKMPKLASVTPSTFNFSNTDGESCVRYTMRFDDVSSVVPVAIGSLRSGKLFSTDVQPGSDPLTYTGCLHCKDCDAGEIDVTLFAAYADTYTNGVATSVKITIETGADPDKGGEDWATITLIIIAFVLVFIAIAVAVVYVRRKHQQREREAQLNASIHINAIDPSAAYRYQSVDTV